MFPGDAADVGLGPADLRRLLGRHAVHGPDQPAVGAPTHPGAGRGPDLPGPHLLLQALREARRALPRLRAYLSSFTYLPAYWLVRIVFK